MSGIRWKRLNNPIIVGASFILGLTGALPLVAQPVQNELAELQRQMLALQARIEQTVQQSDAHLPAGDNDSSRVRSIGVRQAAEAPPPVVIDEVYVKLYDLSDLFSVSAQYPASPPSVVGAGHEIFGGNANYSGTSGMGGGGLGGGGAFNVASAPEPQDADNMPMADVQVSLKKLVQAIKSTIDPDQWETKSRDSNSITILGNMLLVSARDSQHSKIANLIDLFREQWGARRTIAVRLWWIRADLKTIDQLLDSQPQTDIDAGVIDDAKWQSFYEAANEGKRMLYTAHFAGHNGQTLHSWSGRQREQVVSAQPIFSESINRTDVDLMAQTVVGLNPVLSQQFEGAVAQVTPMATRGGNFAILDLHSLVQKLSANDSGAEPPTVSVQGEGEKSFSQKLDTPDLNSWNISTTLRCPKNRIVLAGSMIDNPVGETAGTNVYLFARVTIHTVQEDVTDRPVSR